MSIRTEFHTASVTASGLDPIPQGDSRFYATLRKVALTLPILLLGCGLIYHLMSQPADKPTIPPIQQDPTLFDSKHCKQLKAVWESMKPAVIKDRYKCPCYEVYEHMYTYFNLEYTRPKLEKFASHCQMNMTLLENELPSCPSKKLSEADHFMLRLKLDGLLSFAHNPNLYNSQCGDLDENELYENEKKAIAAINSDRFFPASFKKISQEYLRLRIDDPRPKALFLSSEDTSVGKALDPIEFKDVLQKLNKDSDLKYKLTDGYDAVCHEIYSASMLGKKIRDIYIQADKDLFWNAEKRDMKFDVPNKDKPFSECYHDSYTAEKPEPVWLGW